MISTAEINEAINNLPRYNVEERVARNRKISDLEADWRRWLEFEYAPAINQNALDALFNKAWEMGHSAGYNEVEYYYIDLAELISKAIINDH